MQSDPKDWIALSLLPGVGTVTLGKLYYAGRNPAQLLAHFPETLKPEQRALLVAYQDRQGKLYEQVCKTLEELANLGAQILLPASPDYPPLLKEAHDHPILLFAKGNLQALQLPIVAIVGSRKASTAGLRHAYQFSKALSASGCVVASGLALGIDGAAHQAAVDLQKPTVAVMGTGSDQIYPSRHRPLAESILEHQGVLLTELLPGSGPLAPHFPRRNRIISGLSAGVLVVEAALKSGSLITARQALNQDREVFALPGAIDHPGSRGSNALIREGATLVQTADEMISELSSLLGVWGAERSESQENNQNINLIDQYPILEFIEFTSTSLEDVFLNSGIPMAELQSQLVELELAGLVEMSANGYQRIR